MLFDLITAAKVSIIFIYPKKILTFIENLCFCNLKISGRVPKIPIERKKIKIPIRLKITVKSKNYGLKIPVRARMYARVYVCSCVRVYACAYECGQIVTRTHDHDQHKTSKPTDTPTEHTTTGKRRNTGKAEKPAYICMFAGNEKKSTKKVKKNLEI